MSKTSKTHKILYKVNKEIFLEVTVRAIKVNPDDYSDEDEDTIQEIVEKEVYNDKVIKDFRYYYDSDYDEHKEKSIKYDKLNMIVLVKPNIDEDKYDGQGQLY